MRTSDKVLLSTGLGCLAGAAVTYLIINTANGGVLFLALLGVVLLAIMAGNKHDRALQKSVDENQQRLLSKENDQAVKDATEEYLLKWRSGRRII